MTRTEIATPSRPLTDDAQPRWRAVPAIAIAVAVAAVPAVLGDTIVSLIARQIGVSGKFTPVQPAAYIALTIIGLIAGALGWYTAARRAELSQSLWAQAPPPPCRGGSGSQVPGLTVASAGPCPGVGRLPRRHRAPAADGRHLSPWRLARVESDVAEVAAMSVLGWPVSVARLLLVPSPAAQEQPSLAIS